MNSSCFSLCPLSLALPPYTAVKSLDLPSCLHHHRVFSIKAAHISLALSFAPSFLHGPNSLLLLWSQFTTSLTIVPNIPVSGVKSSGKSSSSQSEVPSSAICLLFTPFNRQLIKLLKKFSPPLYSHISLSQAEKLSVISCVTYDIHCDVQTMQRGCL